ncbi:MAG: hypothetical protein KJT03_23935, partial [Verrucomicrobiae bacterium]|nr:hypothetical protein [Verrucomicrobiae bacterium]
MLEKAYPERKVEVINAAITAVNSHVMLPVAKACLEYDPDFLVVYLGNNEVAGPNAAGSLYSGYFKNLSLLRFSDSIKSLRLYQLIQVLSGRHQVASGTSKGMDFYLENSIFEDDERLQTVYRHFDRNLKDILATAAKKDCPVLLSTVGVNLLDSPPFISRESDNAEASYLKGLEMHEAGNDEEALISLKKARDLDGLRLRADSKVNAVIRQQVDGREDQVIFVDAESRFEQGKSGSLSIPGDNDFLDHVHLAFAGNYTVANAFFEVVLSSLGSPKQTTASMEEVASSLAYSKWDQLTLVRKVTDQILNKPPYTNQWNHAETQLSRRRELRKLASRYTPEVIENTWELYENALKKE